MSFNVNTARRQQAVVHELSKMQILVLYGHQRVAAPPQQFALQGSFPFRTNSPNAPAWLRRLLGDDYFQTVTAVSLEGDLDKIKTALPHLKKLPHLNEIFLSVWPTCGTGRRNEPSPAEFLQRELPNATVTVHAILLVG